MPNCFVKKTSLMLAFTLGTIVVSENVRSADTPALQNVSAAQVTSDLDKNNDSLLTPMSDAAAQGVGCLAMTTAGLTMAYAMGPTELMMLVTGAVIVPSSSSLLFIALGGILGAGTCSVGASLTPSVIWAKENAKGISEKIHGEIKSSLKPKVIVNHHVNYVQDSKEIRSMNEEEIQSAGCLLGLLGIGAVALATAPTEAVMLAAGGVGIPSTTPLLMMGMLGTLLPAGCTFGSALSLPLIESYQNFDKAMIGQKLASMIGWERNLPSALNKKISVSPIINDSSALDTGVSMQIVKKESTSNNIPVFPNP